MRIFNKNSAIPLLEILKAMYFITVTTIIILMKRASSKLTKCERNK